MSVIESDLLKILRCPATGLPLRIEDGQLVSTDGSQHYPIVYGIPCLIPASAKAMHIGHEEILIENERHKKTHKEFTDADVQNFLDMMLVPTTGNLFRGVRLSDEYPIPDFPGVFIARNCAGRRM